MPAAPPRKHLSRRFDQRLKGLGKPAFFVADRNQLVEAVRPHLTGDCVLLLMGAATRAWKDCQQVWDEL